MRLLLVLTRTSSLACQTSILSNNDRLGDEEPVDAVTPDVTGETILRDLGLVVGPVGTPSERLFDVRNANIGGSSSSCSAPLGHFASPRTEVTQEGGILDRGFTGQARSSFASLEDMP